jgi:hypothetical protein
MAQQIVHIVRSAELTESNPSEILTHGLNQKVRIRHDFLQENVG